MEDKKIIKSDDIEYSKNFVSDIAVYYFRQGVLIKTDTRKSDTVYLTKNQVKELYELVFNDI